MRESMNSKSNRLWKSTTFLAALLMLAVSLHACSDNVDTVDSTTPSQAADNDDEAAARYREKVRKRVSASVVSSLSREWDVPESKVECLLEDLDVGQLDNAGSDADVAEVFAKCAVDPAVVK